MGKIVDTSGLDTSRVIGQAKPGNRIPQTVAQPPEPASEPVLETKPIQEKIPQPTEIPPTIEVVREPEASREDSKRRKSKIQDYEALFIKEATGKKSVNKVVYICKEHHDRIGKILHVIGENEITLFSYLYNVIEHHFATFQDDITELYRKRNTDIF